MSSVILQRNGDALTVVEAPDLAYFTSEITRTPEITLRDGILTIASDPPVRYRIVGDSLSPAHPSTWVAERHW